jgi:hypothetical protein
LNAPRVLISIGVLVIAVFMGVLVDLFLGTIGYIILLSAPFITLLVVGIYGLVSALTAGSQQTHGSRAVGALGFTVLRMIAQGKSQQDIANATSVSLIVVGAKVDALTRAGFLEDNSLTEKGFEAIKAVV